MSEPLICLNCVKARRNRMPDSLTWFFGDCWVCKVYALCTKTRHIQALRGLV